jgi:hypothetical protein
MDEARLERLIAPDAARHVATRASAATQKRLKVLAGPMEATTRRPIAVDDKRAVRLADPTATARNIHPR